MQLSITIASLKGGGGKSNLAANLSVGFQQAGYSVVIVDADRVMNTSEQWHDDREEYIEENPDSGIKQVPVVKKTGRLGSTIEELSNTYEIVIVDTGGQDSSEMRSALGVVDVALTPVEPTQEALDGVAPFIDIIDEVRNFNEDLIAVSVLSRVQPNAPKRVSDAHDYLEDFVEEYDLKIAKSHITNRVIYPDSKASGLSVLESKNENAKTEVEALVQELLKIKEEH